MRVSLSSIGLSPWTRTDRKAAAVLAAIACGEGVWAYFQVLPHPARFWHFIGLHDLARAGSLAWVLSLGVAAVFVLYSSKIPAVRETLFTASRLKALGLVVACGASLCEETIIRKIIMDAIQSRGHSVLLQVAVSALAFGLLHSIWGLMGGRIAIAIGAMVATTILGALLALVYVASHRLLAPCILAHFLIDAFTEPGLVLAGLRGQMRSAVAVPG
jgi:hypothetical protein